MLKNKDLKLTTQYCYLEDTYNIAFMYFFFYFIASTLIFTKGLFIFGFGMVLICQILLIAYDIVSKKLKNEKSKKETTKRKNK
jgi:hypothetical protein